MKSANLSEQTSRRLGPWATFFLGFGLLAVLVVLVLVVATLIWAKRVSDRVESQLAQIREAGEPTSVAELEERYQLSDEEEDTAWLWLEATCPLDADAFATDAGELPIVGTGESEIPPPGEPWGDLEAAEALLEKYAVSLQRLHEAADVAGPARYPTNLSLGLDMPLEHLQSLRRGARLLALEAHVRAHRADPHGAARAIHAIFMLARSLEREPILVSLLVRVACDGIARDQLRLLLPTVDFPEEDLFRLRDDLRAIDYHEGLQEAMLGERIIGIEVSRDPHFIGLDVPTSRGWQLTQRPGLALYLEHVGQLVGAAKMPWPEALEAAEQADKRLQEVIDNLSPPVRVVYMIPALVAPAVAAVFTATGRNVAMNGAADAAIGVERYRRKHGRLPERLEQLVPEFLPEVPVDPYDGQPLRYVVQDGGYLVYSIGTNRTDDGGASERALEGLERDLVFQVGPPPETDKDHAQQDPAEPAN